MEEKVQSHEKNRVFPSIKSHISIAIDGLLELICGLNVSHKPAS